MDFINSSLEQPVLAESFYWRPPVQMGEIAIGPGLPIGIETVRHSRLAIAGAYGSWGHAYDNAALPALIEHRLGRPLADSERLSLGDLGFRCRQHVPQLSPEQDLAVEVEAGARFLRAAAAARDWDTAEVEAVVLGMSSPVSTDFLERAAGAAGIPEDALKVSIHKACDGSVAGLNLALDPELAINRALRPSLAARLTGKKVLLGGLEGLSRNFWHIWDTQALQLFGSAAGILAIVPGQDMTFLAGATNEVFDHEGLLKVRMPYPHSRQRVAGQSMLELSEGPANSLRVAGLMPEPATESGPVEMATFALARLFIRHGVPIVRQVYRAYHERMEREGTPDREIRVAVVHHANLKINQLKAKTLGNEGIRIPMPWVLSEFGNCSAASPMIAFLRLLPELNPGDHVLFDGFGAGTYYDVVAAEMGGAPA